MKKSSDTTLAFAHLDISTAEEKLVYFNLQ